MKGKLCKVDKGWAVKFEDIARLFPFTQYYTRELPLHPKDVLEIKYDSHIFDNIEARIAAYPDVEFEIVEEREHRELFEEYGWGNAITYAKLIKEK